MRTDHNRTLSSRSNVVAVVFRTPREVQCAFAHALALGGVINVGVYLYVCALGPPTFRAYNNVAI